MAGAGGYIDYGSMDRRSGRSCAWDGCVPSQNTEVEIQGISTDSFSCMGDFGHCIAETHFEMSDLSNLKGGEKQDVSNIVPGTNVWHKCDERSEIYKKLTTRRMPS